MTLSNRDIFLKSVVVLDTETTNMIPEECEIVELASARYDGANWLIDEELFGADNGIPPEASAKNNISSRMIEGKLSFAKNIKRAKEILDWDNAKFFVAHNCDYDQRALANAWAMSGNISDLPKTFNKNNWICTFRLAKHLLDFDFSDMQYNLNYLRYKLDLPVDEKLPSHRAGADTLVCAVLFEFLFDYAIAMDRIIDGSDDFGEQLSALCWKPIIIKKWPFGKNRNKLLTELDTDYYLWALKNIDALNIDKPQYDIDLAESVRVELESRLT